MKKELNLICSLLLFSVTVAGQATCKFLNPELPIVERVNDLVGRLTLEEKISQMLNNAPAIDRLGIPAYNWWNECLHGVARSPYPVTSFPQAIAMAATWDTEFIKWQCMLRMKDVPFITMLPGKGLPEYSED